MIRISDIYKKNEEKKVPEPPPEVREKIEPGPEKEGCDAEEVYNESLLLLKDKFDTCSRGKRIVLSGSELRLISRLSSCSREKSREMMNFFYESTPSNYMYAHGVNVCILANVLIRNMIYNRDQVMKLSMASFFHDLGLAEYVKIINRETSLSSLEKIQIQEHPENVKKFIKRIDSMDPPQLLDLLKLISQHHERADGSGYPRGLKGGEIDRMASLIALCDLYEALTHPRPWRKAYNRARAIEIIISSRKKLIPPEIVKSLIDELSLFPEGSELRLCDGRLVRVTNTNSESPLCPQVRVIEKEGSDSPGGEVIDLSTQKLISIEDICGEGDLYET